MYKITCPIDLDTARTHLEAFSTGEVAETIHIKSIETILRRNKRLERLLAQTYKTIGCLAQAL